MNIEKEIQSINSKLSKLLIAQRKETWVSARVISGITGWDNTRLRQMRNNGVVEYVVGKGYKIESIPEVLIRKQTA